MTPARADRPQARVAARGLSREQTGLRDPERIGSSEQMRTFVVECYWPGMLEEHAREILERVIPIAARATPGEAVRSLGCFLLPSDGMALYFFSAPSEAVVRRIGSVAEVPFDRIVEAVDIGRQEPNTSSRGDTK